MKFDKIIIEGPNNVGKSTVIDRLQQYLNFEREHVTSVCPNGYHFYDDLLSCNEPLIFDRLHLGEMVYPEIYDRTPQLSENEFDELCEKHSEHTFIVIIDADFDFIMRANSCKNERFNYFETWQEKKEFYRLYQYLKTNDIPCIRLKNHWEEGSDIKLCKQILGAIGYDISQ